MLVAFFSWQSNFNTWTRLEAARSATWQIGRTQFHSACGINPNSLGTTPQDLYEIHLNYSATHRVEILSTGHSASYPKYIPTQSK